jgi:predicted anti-sigma-YlaC factor YlaD
MKDRSCFSVQQLLALRPADWDDDERRQVVAHLATCTQCEKLSRAYAVQDRTLQSIPVTRLDTTAWERLQARLAPERQRGALRPQTAWVLGAVALVLVALIAGLVFLPGNWLRGTAGDTPTIGPTQVLMPSPTITPTTALTPTPVGERDFPSTVPFGEVIPYTPRAGLGEEVTLVALYGRAVGPGSPLMIAAGLNRPQQEGD